METHQNVFLFHDKNNKKLKEVKKNIPRTRIFIYNIKDVKELKRNEQPVRQSTTTNYLKLKSCRAPYNTIKTKGNAEKIFQNTENKNFFFLHVFKGAYYCSVKVATQKNSLFFLYFQKRFLLSICFALYFFYIFIYKQKSRSIAVKASQDINLK